MRQYHSDEQSSFASLESLESRVLLSGTVPPNVLDSDHPFQAVVTADFDGDGDNDIAVSTGGRIGLLLNRGNGEFDPVRWTAAQHWPEFLAPADIDGDGRDELIALGTTVNGQRGHIRALEYDADRNRFVTLTARSHPRHSHDLLITRGADGADHIIFGGRLGTLPDDAGANIRGVSMSLVNGKLTVVDVAFQVPWTQYRGMSAGDLDSDNVQDIVLSLDTSVQLGPDESTIVILRGSADTMAAGSFGEPETLYTIDTDALRTALVDDVDGDLHLDLVFTTSSQVLLARGDGGGGFLSPEVLHDTPLNFGDIPFLEIVGFQTGPSGNSELLVQAVVTNSLIPRHSQSLLRLLPDGDGNFATRTAFSRETNGVILPHAYYVINELSGDEFADAIWVHGLSENRIRIFTFDGTDRSPIIDNATVHRAMNRNSQVVRTGQQADFLATVFDPEERIGDGGGIASTRFYLDTNNNGIIDPGDVLAATAPGRITITAQFPRGTFNVLVQAMDVVGNFSEIHCMALPLTII